MQPLFLLRLQITEEVTSSTVPSEPSCVCQQYSVQGAQGYRQEQCMAPGPGKAAKVTDMKTSLH